MIAPPAPPSDIEIAAMRRDLAAADPALAALEAQTPAFTWRVRPGGFGALCRFVAEQQISQAAAAAVTARLHQGLCPGGDGAVTGAAVLNAGPERLRALGLSAPKAERLIRIARAEAAGEIDFHALPAMTDDEALAALSALHGIGPWTAGLYLMFCLGRRDVFPAADVALQSAAGWMDRIDPRPDAKALALRARAFSPHRTAAAHLMWAWIGARRHGAVA